MSVCGIYLIISQKIMWKYIRKVLFNAKILVSVYLINNCGTISDIFHLNKQCF